MTSPMKPISLDVRPILAGGGTPCAAIDEAAARVAVGQSLVLLVPFEPVPLYAKFERQGFTHQSQELPDGTWQVEFMRLEAATEGDVAPIACSCGH
jgi:uncharacterized protein (DUF2249 family)